MHASFSRIHNRVDHLNGNRSFARHPPECIGLQGKARQHRSNGKLDLHDFLLLLFFFFFRSKEWM